MSLARQEPDTVEGLQHLVERLNATIAEQQGMINSLVVLAEQKPLGPVDTSAFDGWQRTLLLNRELERRVREVGEAERLLRSVVDSLDSRMCILGADGRIVGTNRLWAALAAEFDWPSGTAGEGGDFFGLLGDFGPELAEPVEAALRRAQAGDTGDQSIKGPLRVARRDEHVIVRIHPVRDHDVATLVVTVVDITEAHRTQQELDRVTAEANRRTRSLVEQLEVEKTLLADVLGSIPQLVYWKDEQLRYAGVNEAFLRLRGLAGEDEVIGRTEAELTAQDELSAALAEIEPTVLATGQRVDDRRIVLSPAGGPARGLLVGVLPQTDADHRMIGVIGVAADVTHVSTLEQQLAQATRLESIGQLAAGIAHEINTPVQFVSDNTRFLAESFGGVMVALELARELPSAGPDGAARLARVLTDLDLDFLGEEIPGAISQSQEGLERVAQIVRAMKDFSHPGQGKAEADVNRAVESTTQVCRNEWRYVAELTLSLSPAVGQVPCYEGELKQALLNIVVNAAQAIAEQREATGSQALGRISVATQRLPGVVRITVADDGPGMTPDVQRRIFDPFFTTKPVGRGTGQGLSMAYASIVTKHGGSLSVDSAPGAGTTFTLDLPT